MEGILIDTTVIGSAPAIAGGVLLLAVACCFAIFGYMSDGEAECKRFYWSEWPLPGSEETTPEVEELRLAA